MLSIVGDYSGEHYIKHYKNSALYSTKNDSGTMLYPTGIRARYIGAYGPGSGIMLGYIDDVRLYNRVLSSEEITDIYNKTKHKYQ